MTGIQGLTAEQEAFASHAGGAFVHACPGAGKTRTIIARLVKVAAALPPRRGVAVLSFTNSAVDEFRKRCRAPNAQWSSLLQVPVELGLVCAKIHEAKGRQYDGVCVVIPPNRAPENRVEALFDSWSNRTDTEAKRVIYVGVTRALHLSAIAVPVAFADRCAALLAAGQVPHTRTNL